VRAGTTSADAVSGKIRVARSRVNIGSESREP